MDYINLALNNKRGEPYSASTGGFGSQVVRDAESMTMSHVTHHPAHPGMGMNGFYWSDDTTILFGFWATETVGQYLASCLCFFVLAMLYEWLSSFRFSYAKELREAKEKKEQTELASEKSLLLNGDTPLGKIAIFMQRFTLLHLKLTVMHMIQLTLAYTLMLVIMTYNVGLGLSVMGGYALGFFIFASAVPERAAEPASCH